MTVRTASRGASLLACLSLFFVTPRAAVAEDPAVSAGTVRYAVLPGERVSDFCERLDREGISSREIFLRIASSSVFPAFPFVPAPRPDVRRFEGLFVPGRYSLSYDGTSRGALSGAQKLALTKEMIGQLLRASARRFRRFHSRISLSLAQSITLASIVEKEAVDGRDYGMIASVFSNRLRSDMPLASCPSVEYFLGYHRPYLLSSDILIDSAYNLYLHRGLPPTPIAFFSDQAFRSAMDPPASPYQFLVFDWAKGVHYFATDFTGHQANIDASLKDFVAAYGAGEMFRKHPGKFYQY